MARADLVIADIGGCTKFMRVHRVNLAHAQYVIAQLLEAAIDGFYAKLPNSGDPQLDPYACAITDIRRELHERLSS